MSLNYLCITDTFVSLLVAPTFCSSLIIRFVLTLTNVQQEENKKYSNNKNFEQTSRFSGEEKRFPCIAFIAI